MLTPIPVKKLSSKGYAQDMAAKIKNGEKANIKREISGLPESKDTTHLVVADNEGNVVNLKASNFYIFFEQLSKQIKKLSFKFLISK